MDDPIKNLSGNSEGDKYSEDVMILFIFINLVIGIRDNFWTKLMSCQLFDKVIRVGRQDFCSIILRYVDNINIFWEFATFNILLSICAINEMFWRHPKKR